MDLKKVCSDQFSICDYFPKLVNQADQINKIYRSMQENISIMIGQKGKSEKLLIIIIVLNGTYE